jgi:hypothetical protein
MIQIVITISESYLDQLEALVESLRGDGLVITRYYAFGVIVGIADQEVILRIRNYKEIISLSEEKEVFITPPPSDTHTFPDE